MKFAGPHLLFFVVAGTLVAQPAEPAPPVKTSARLTQEIRGTLQKYSPPPPAPAEATVAPDAAPASAPDPDVLVLPTLSVREKKRLPSDAADHLMSKRDFNRKMENIYYDAVAAEGPLNAFLNGHAIPILNAISIPLPPRRGDSIRSVETVRGRAIYEGRKLAELIHVVETTKQVDARVSTELKKTVGEILEVKDRNNRVTGDK